MCFLVFGFCLVGCISRWDLSLSDNNSVPFGTYHQVQLLIYLSSVFPQSGFRLHSSFAEIFSRTEVVFIVVFSHFYGSKGIFLGILQSVDLLNMMQFMHINFEQRVWKGGSWSRIPAPFSLESRIPHVFHQFPESRFSFPQKYIKKSNFYKS